MATAQQQAAISYANTITAASINLHRISSVSVFADGIIELVGNDATVFSASVLTGIYTIFAGGIEPFSTYVAGSPYKAYIIFPSTTGPGDQWKMHIDGLDLFGDLDAGGVYDAGGIAYDGDNIDAWIPNAAPAPGKGETNPTPPTVPGGGTGSPILPSTRALAPNQRALVVYQANSAADGGGKMFALNTNNASGVPIPAFRTVVSNPATGTMQGEAVLNTTTGLSYVWDGAVWQPIVPPSVVSYPTDTDVVADNAATVGTYAFSQATGNFFVRFNDGVADTWRQIGVRTYTTEAGLLVDIPADGSIGFAADTGMLWYRVAGAWKSGSFHTDTEANVLASTPTAGLVGVTTDTGRIYLANGTDWVGAYVHEYTTDALLRAATPLDGELGVALDTGLIYYRTGGVWLPLNLQAIPNGTADPVTAVLGELFYNTTEAAVKVYDGASWVPFSVDSIGDLTDVDITTTAPTNKDTLVWNDTTNKFEVGKGGGVVMGTEPILADRYDGLLWCNGARVWIWHATPGVWVEV